MFTVELEYVDGTPEELRCNLPDIDVPALPPENSILNLFDPDEDKFFSVKVSQVHFFAEDDINADVLLKVLPL